MVSEKERKTSPVTESWESFSLFFPQKVVHIEHTPSRSHSTSKSITLKCIPGPFSHKPSSLQYTDNNSSPNSIIVAQICKRTMRLREESSTRNAFAAQPRGSLRHQQCVLVFLLMYQRAKHTVIHKYMQLT